MFLIENNHTPIGMVGVDWREPETPELGYWLGVEHWGQGFATEAARAVIDFTFEEFDIEQLVSGARVANPASRNILEKCGFQWSGVELHRFEALGSSTPVDCFRLSRSVWASLKNWGNSTRRSGSIRHSLPGGRGRWVSGSRPRRIDHRLHAPEFPLAQENIEPGADDDGRAECRRQRRHIAEHEIAEHHRPEDHRILIRHDHARRCELERAVDAEQRATEIAPAATNKPRYPRSA